jgi:hypothetical protein
LNLTLGSRFAVDLPGVFRDLIVDDLDLQGAVRILGILQVALEKQISLVFQLFALRRIVGSGFSQWVGSHKTKYTPFTPLFAVRSELRERPTPRGQARRVPENLCCVRRDCYRMSSL